MPVSNVGSRWSGGDLIFYEKNVSLGTIGNILTIGDDAVTVGSATNDINFSWKGTTTGTFDLDAGAHTLAMTGMTADVGTSCEADAYTVGGVAGIDESGSGTITTFTITVVKGIVTAFAKVS